MPQWEAPADRCSVSVENLGTRDSLACLFRYPKVQRRQSASDGEPPSSVMTVLVQCRLLDLYKNRILLPLCFISQVDLLCPGMPDQDLKETSWNQLFQNLRIKHVCRNKDCIYILSWFTHITRNGRKCNAQYGRPNKQHLCEFMSDFIADLKYVI